MAAVLEQERVRERDLHLTAHHVGIEGDAQDLVVRQPGHAQVAVDLDRLPVLVIGDRPQLAAQRADVEAAIRAPLEGRRQRDRHVRA